MYRLPVLLLLTFIMFEPVFGQAQTFGLSPNTVTCLQRSKYLVWAPVPDPSVKVYLIYADKDPESITDPERRMRLAPVGEMPYSHTEFQLPGKFRKTLYYFAVVSVNALGKKSEPSEIISCVKR
jgi:hypothetical protein